jgi:predicted TIM-barrel fold metal-dependent hydrolase
MDEPTSKVALTRSLELLDAGRTLMFSTDYPHYDFDDPSRILRKVPKEIRSRIAYQNAVDWFGLPSELSTGPGDVRPEADPVTAVAG